MNLFPFVSVIITTHNRCHRLALTLDSILKQDYPSTCFEIMIIDNASTDGTAQLVQSLKCKSLSYVRRDFDGGVASSRNIGISKSKGEIVAFIDDDCVAEKNWLKEGVAKFSNNVGIVQGKTLPDPGVKIRFFSRTISCSYEDSTYPTCNIFFAKEALLSNGGFDESWDEFRDVFGLPIGGNDADLAWRIKGMGWKSVFADRAVVYHEVFHRTVLQWLLEAFKKLDYPYILKRIPQVAFRRFFVTEFTAAFDLLLLSLVLGFLVHWVFLLLGFPYLFLMWRKRWLSRNWKALPQLLLYLVKDFITFVSLIIGSLRHRSLWI